MVEAAAEDADCGLDDGVMARCEVWGNWLECPCRDPDWREGKDDREEKDRLPLRDGSSCAVELTIGGKLEVKGEDEEEFRTGKEGSREELRLVESGVRPRRGAGSPQADCCPLTGRKPEL